MTSKDRGFHAVIQRDADQTVPIDQERYAEKETLMSTQSCLGANVPKLSLSSSSSFSDVDRGKRVKQSKYIQQPQHDGNDHDALQD